VKLEPVQVAILHIAREAGRQVTMNDIGVSLGSAPNQYEKYRPHVKSLLDRGFFAVEHRKGLGMKWFLSLTEFGRHALELAE
jgi:hypothetical protein